jgi:hypothetical protein
LFTDVEFILDFCSYTTSTLRSTESLFAKKLAYMASFVPCGRPPFVFFHDEYEFSIRTHCSRLLRKLLIHLMHALWQDVHRDFPARVYYDIMINKMNPFLKSAKNNLAEQEPFSRAGKWCAGGMLGHES